MTKEQLHNLIDVHKLAGKCLEPQRTFERAAITLQPHSQRQALAQSSNRRTKERCLTSGGTTADDLFPLFDKYGKVVDIFIPRDRRTGDSRGFAFVRYKYADEAQKAVDRLDGRVVDGREITVQFAKYGPNAERIQKGRIIESFPRSKHRSRSRSPRRRYRDDYRDRDYRRRSHSRSWDRYERDRYRGRDRDYRRRSRSRSASPDYSRGRGRGRYDDYRRSPSRSVGSASPAQHSPSPGRSLSPRKNSPLRGESSDGRSRGERSPAPRSASPRGGHGDTRSYSPGNSDVDD
ncbi:serine/arginine-rich splicing factor SC35 [Citrus sinensis]|nr:serine/arginine-rich splicing factor SC35 [Citrus sinensis]